MAARLSLSELARRSGVAADTLEEWRSCGLIGHDGSGSFAPSDLKRVTLIRLLLRRGLEVAALARAEQAEGFVTRYVDYLLPGAVGERCSLEDAADRLGLELETLAKLVDAGGLDDPDQPFSEVEVEVLRGMKVILDSGLPVEALIQLVRVYAEALARVGEAEVKLFHFYVRERLRAEGASGEALVAATQVARARMLPLAEPSILYFHRRGFSRAVREDAVMHLQGAVGFAVPGQLQLAVVFVDLSSFTSLADVMGDEAAANVLTRFSELVRDATLGGDGRVTKQIGDAFMLVFPVARSAVGCALAITEPRATRVTVPGGSRRRALGAGALSGRGLRRDERQCGGRPRRCRRPASSARERGRRRPGEDAGRSRIRPRRASGAQRHGGRDRALRGSGEEWVRAGRTARPALN